MTRLTSLLLLGTVMLIGPTAAQTTQPAPTPNAGSPQIAVDPLKAGVSHPPMSQTKEAARKRGIKAMKHKKAKKALK